MKPFHYQYARHLSRQATREVGKLIHLCQSMVNESNLLNSENIGAARALTSSLKPVFEQNKHESRKIENAKKAHAMSREALKAKTTDTADSGESCESSTHSPAQADSDDGGDGDGDGDGDPDPERQTKRRTARPLPPAQLSRPKAACALLGIGRTKLWQLSEQDPRFPRKIVLGPRCVGWRTDALIGYLRTLEQEA